MLAVLRKIMQHLVAQNPFTPERRTFSSLNLSRSIGNEGRQIDVVIGDPQCEGTPAIIVAEGHVPRLEPLDTAPVPPQARAGLHAAPEFRHVCRCSDGPSAIGDEGISTRQDQGCQCKPRSHVEAF